MLFENPWSKDVAWAVGEPETPDQVPRPFPAEKNYPKLGDCILPIDHTGRGVTLIGGANATMISFKRAQEVEERFLHDFDGVDFTMQ